MLSNIFQREYKSMLDFIIDKKIVGINEEKTKLKSGISSYWYVNWRDISNNFFDLYELMLFLEEYIDNNSIEKGVFYGVPEGMTKLGTIFQWENKDNNYILVRGKGEVSKEEIYSQAQDIVNHAQEGKYQIIGCPYDDTKVYGIIYQYISSLANAYTAIHDILYSNNRSFDKNINSFYITLIRDKEKDYGKKKDRSVIGEIRDRVMMLTYDEEKAEEAINKIKRYHNFDYVIKKIRPIELRDNKDKEIILLEDVSTTGASSLKEVRRLRDKGYNVNTIISLTNRQHIINGKYTIEDVMKREGINYYAITTGKEIINRMLENGNINEEIYNKLKEEFKKYNSVSLD